MCDILRIDFYLSHILALNVGSNYLQENLNSFLYSNGQFLSILYYSKLFVRMRASNDVFC